MKHAIKHMTGGAALLLLSSLNFSLAQQAPSVFVAKVQMAEFVDEIEALGTLQSNENVELFSTVTERIVDINFNDNQRVKKGDVLVRMDTAQENAELVEEQFRRDEAERQVKRLRRLVATNVASEALLDEQEREFNASNARIRAIQSRIDERTIVAPFDGVVGLRNISVGALVGPTSPNAIITTIDDISVMKLDFSIPEVFLNSISQGLIIEASSRSYPDTVFSGTITSIDSRIDPITRAVSARAIIPNDDGILKAGMLMRIRLFKSPRMAIVVPEESIITAGRQKSVMLVNRTDADKGVVERKSVNIGARRQGEVEIVSGIDAGDLVLSHGAIKVQPGAEVHIKAIEKGNQILRDLLTQNVKE
ncbi:MAG: efflux RND transporter periplasmic adaptor subunit [Pseudomonadota bacterium]